MVRIQATEGIGTGFIIDQSGLIVTNAHLVGEDLTVDVTMSDGTVRGGLVLGRAKTEDVALLIIDGYKMPTVDLGASGRPRVGDEVLAMGYAFDLPGSATLTRGLVSAFRPNAFGPLTALQTDTAVNPGNSGGPLVDLMGQVVGINTAGILEGEGINFAIVIDDAMGIINELRAGRDLPLGRHVSQAYPFSVTAPDGWRVYEVAPHYVYLRDEESSAEIYVLVEQLVEGVTTDRFADTQTRLGAEGENDFYEKISTRKTTVAGLPAWEVIETWKRKENDFHHTGAEYFLVSGGLGYSIYTQSERSGWDAIKPAIDGIVAGFTIDTTASTASPATPTATARPTATPAPGTQPTHFGPAEGRIDHNPTDGLVPVFNSETNLTNAVIEATFITPFFITGRTWSSGFALRRDGTGLHVVVTRSTGVWYHYLRKATTGEYEEIQEQSSPHIATGNSVSNHARVIALNDEGWLFINGNYAGELDLIGWNESGTVDALGAFFGADELAGQSTEFRDFTVRSLQPVYGPRSGVISHEPDPGNIQAQDSNALLSDTITEARFFNPYAASMGSWSSGFLLRFSGLTEFHAAIIHQSGRWFHYVRTGVPSGLPQQNQVSQHISTSPSGSNFIRLIALGDEGWLFVNGAYVAKLDLTGWSKKGSVAAVGQFFSGDGIVGKSTSFEGFVVWSVGVDGETR